MTDDVEAVLAELIAHQHKKVFALAQRLIPNITDDDITQPQDFPALAQSPEWNYEDGILAGYRSAQMALRAAHRR